jgi:hypothetical protein
MLLVDICCWRPLPQPATRSGEAAGREMSRSREPFTQELRHSNCTSSGNSSFTDVNGTQWRRSVNRPLIAQRGRRPFKRVADDVVTK